MEESFKNKGLKATREVKSSLFLEMVLSFTNGRISTINEVKAATKILPINRDGKRYDKNSKRKALLGIA